MDGCDDERKLPHWRGVHLGAGLYVVDVGSTEPLDTIEGMFKQGMKTLIDMHKNVPAGKVPITSCRDVE